MYKISLLLGIGLTILSTFISNCSDKKCRYAGPLAQSSPTMGTHKMTKQKVFTLAKKNGWIKECKGTNPMTVGEMKKIFSESHGVDSKSVVLLPVPNEDGIQSLDDSLSVTELQNSGISVFSVHLKYRVYHAHCYKHRSCRKYADKRKSCEF